MLDPAIKLRHLATFLEVARREGFARAAAELHVSQPAVSKTIRELEEQDEPPTVIVCANDVVAYGAFNAARSLGRDVPGDVSIVGFDDLPETRWPLLQITTVAFDLEAMARRGAQLLVDRMRAGADEPYRHEWFPSHLVERATLGPVPTR